jgi:2-oxoglutarate ferredoxin oxidoreductase subunit alpha
MEKVNNRLQQKYREVEANEVRYETFLCEDADYLLVAFGSSARICQKSVELLREEGIKVGLFRPITLYPYPVSQIHEYAKRVKGMLSVEMNAGQMVEDVRLAVNGLVPVEFYGRYGGMIPTPEEIVKALKEKLMA